MTGLWRPSFEGTSTVQRRFQCDCLPQGRVVLHIFVTSGGQGLLRGLRDWYQTRRIERQFGAAPADDGGSIRRIAGVVFQPWVYSEGSPSTNMD